MPMSKKDEGGCGGGGKAPRKRGREKRRANRSEYQEAFDDLRKLIPRENPKVKLSKQETLESALMYIHFLHQEIFQNVPGEIYLFV